MTIENHTIVSMNFWGFRPEIFSVFEQAYDAFVRRSSRDDDAELYIPAVVDLAIKSGLTKVKVFPTAEMWKGVTFAEIREVQEELGVNISNYTLFRVYNCTQGDVKPNIKHVFSARMTQRADELTLYEGQYHLGISLEQRHKFNFANILGKILDDYVEVMKLT